MNQRKEYSQKRTKDSKWQREATKARQQIQEKKQGNLTWKNTRINEDKGHQKDVYEDIGY